MHLFRPGRALALLFSIALLGTISTKAKADGTEALGDPSIAIAEGTRITAAGVGLTNGQPGLIEFDVAANEAIAQVILYWEGFTNNGGSGDDTIEVDGMEVLGRQIGGTTNFFPGAWTTSYRADITDKVDTAPSGAPRTVSLSIGGLSFERNSHGAGVLVILDDGGDKAQIGVKDGNDTAFINFAPPLDATVPVEFNFVASAEPRIATLAIFAASVTGPDLEEFRPNVIRVTYIDEAIVMDFPNLLGSFDGDEWDSLLVDVPILAGVSRISVEVQSEDTGATGFLPASLVWIGAGFSLDSVPDDVIAEGCTPGFWKNHTGTTTGNQTNAWGPTGYSPGEKFNDVFNVSDIDITLLAALQTGGGGIKKLRRHGVAALLNAAHPEIDYPLTEADVLSMIKSAIDSGDRTTIRTLGGTLADFNEIGCEDAKLLD